jgi:hypothetical protein
MYVIVSRTLHLRLPGRDVCLEPGRLEHVELTKEQVNRLLGQVSDVRLLKEGSRVVWHSPLFARCEARVALLPEDGWIGIDRHPIVGEPMLLPLAWIEEIVGDHMDGHTQELKRS